MTLGVAPELAATYTSPGQYIEVSVEHARGFFVLANEPGAPTWELVMRPGGGASDVLLVAPTGLSLEVTNALGHGFPMELAGGGPLIIVLGGTGIAAGRPLVAHRISQGDAARTDVLIGARTRAEFGMRGDVERWRQAGVRVLVCLSNDDGPIDGIPWSSGYVQDVLRAGSAAVPESRIFAVGASSMIDALRNVAPALGISPDRVSTNH